MNVRRHEAELGAKFGYGTFNRNSRPVPSH